MRNPVLPLFLVIAWAGVTLGGICYGQYGRESFEAYAPGTDIIGQGSWEGWDGLPFVGALVTPTEANMGSQSLELDFNSDVVQVFDGVYTSGRIEARAWIKIPRGATGGQALLREVRVDVNCGCHVLIGSI